ncbi:beta-L-arabinofuranosidase domain-containing protein, partial [Myxococcota bacterium]
FLVRHQREDGKYCYQYDPFRGCRGGSYNLLRHAGTTYSLYQAYALTGDVRHLEGAERAMAWLIGHRVVDSEDFSYVVSGTLVKLGGAALALLALTERERLLEDGRHDGVMARFGRFIEHQMAADGELKSYYQWSDAHPAPQRTSIYYPGEATFALARLHQVTGDDRWLDSAARAAQYMIRRGTWLGVDFVVFPDAWLLCALSLLYEQTGEDKYLTYARTIADDLIVHQYGDENEPEFSGAVIDPVLPTSTPAATRAEGLGALCHAMRVTGLDDESGAYRAALLATTRFQLSQQAGATNSYFYRQPDLARGGFFCSMLDQSMRIDYTQHNISSLIWALEWLPEREP